MKKVLLTFIAVVLVFSFSISAVAQQSYKLGDVNGDGILSIMDATCIQLYVAELYEKTENFSKNADVDGDSRISVFDATSIQLFLAQIIDKLPGEDIVITPPSIDSDGYYDQIVKP